MTDTPEVVEPQTPPPREPAFNMPGIVLAWCLVLLAIHALRMTLSGSADDAVVSLFGFVPARIAIALGIARQQLEAAVQAMPQDTFRALIGDGGARWWTFVTYAFLHASWMHVGLNCVWLAAFGSPVARRFAPLRFCLLMLVTAACGAVAQFAWDPASFAPVIGASAAVSGAMGAATRFVFRSHDEPVRFFHRAQIDAAYRQPALTLAETLQNRVAFFFVAIWFGTNVLFGLIPALGGYDDGPIAWQAHIGGFVAGLLLFPLFDRAHPDPREDHAADVPTVDTTDPV